MVEIAYRRVQDAVMTSELRPGDRVPQDVIASELGISRMPLRLALRQLEELTNVVLRRSEAAVDFAKAQRQRFEISSHRPGPQ